ncbi:DinB family protein [Rhodococcus sp. ABRD24]|uniref:DinB family protein n=1 Tax=Rhodococcus sp. ABRD24 TaxID=2507582 RepID=UPI00103F3B1C|nr:DinB family protein [Rhodococcus sp. ABRD24]QBJ96375.1 DinB family protein [Rhodococcus sp. ABRD24]
MALYDHTIRTTTEDRAMLERMLDVQRAELLHLVDGMSEANVRQRLVPSLTTLLGLVKHGIFVEKVWFHHRIAGRPRSEVDIPDDIDESFRLTDSDSIESVSAAFTAACARSRTVAADHPDLAETISWHKGDVTLRFIFTHLIQEYARHAGQGDILREQIAATS